MNPLANIINVVAFSALFIAYASVAATEKPSGVRRALQTYAGQVVAVAPPIVNPVWKIGSDLA